MTVGDGVLALWCQSLCGRVMTSGRSVGWGAGGGVRFRRAPSLRAAAIEVAQREGRRIRAARQDLAGPKLPSRVERRPGASGDGPLSSRVVEESHGGTMGGCTSAPTAAAPK